MPRIVKNSYTTSVKKELFQEIKSKGILKKDDNKNVKDWFRVHQEGTDNKYGVLMYSPSLDIFRNTTFDEFYDGAIVD